MQTDHLSVAAIKLRAWFNFSRVKPYTFARTVGCSEPLAVKLTLGAMPRVTVASNIEKLTGIPLTDWLVAHVPSPGGVSHLDPLGQPPSDGSPDPCE